MIDRGGFLHPGRAYRDRRPWTTSSSPLAAAHLGSLSQRPLDELDQVLHDEALFRADVDAGATAAKVIRDDRANGRHARALQTLSQRVVHIPFGGDLVQPVDLRRAGEDEAIDAAGGELA